VTKGIGRESEKKKSEKARRSDFGDNGFSKDADGIFPPFLMD